MTPTYAAALCYTHIVTRTAYGADGEVIYTNRYGLRSKAAAARKVSQSKQFDGEEIKMGRRIEYTVTAL